LEFLNHALLRPATSIITCPECTVPIPSQHILRMLKTVHRKIPPLLRKRWKTRLADFLTATDDTSSPDVVAVASAASAASATAHANDVASLAWIHAHTKPCPKCAVRIEKNDGCEEMRCRVCNAAFCWECNGIDWCVCDGGREEICPDEIDDDAIEEEEEEEARENNPVLEQDISLNLIAGNSLLCLFGAVCIMLSIALGLFSS